MSRPTLLLATRNAGKAGELRALLNALPLELCDLRDFPHAPDVAEEGATYIENARAKALAAARFSGLPALADDSGLEVDALGGEPGVLSARFAGPLASDASNIDLLLRRLDALPGPARTARFRCLVVVAYPDGRMLSAEGTVEGTITAEPVGTGGFGYDPVFFYPPAQCTFAQLSAGEKNHISHRAAACRALSTRLIAFLGDGAR